jgi:CubicO group peptidase (beta-lactamase class C family)
VNTKPIGRHVKCLVLLWAFSIVVAGCVGHTPAATPTLAPSQTPTSTEYWPTKGWRTSTPDAQGMDSQKLALMLDTIKQQNLNLHSLLVIRNGYIVSETYFQSYSQDQKHELYSCTKSFISTLVGIAIDKGYIAGVNRAMQDFFPGRPFENQDARKEAMTLEDLLTMTSGLDWQEGDPIYREMYVSGDWVRFVLDQPMSAQPGSQFNYCSGCSHVLSAIVQQKTGMSTRNFAQKELFAPLGISSFNWDTDSSGIPIGGWGLQITPRDMAKLGYLYLHNGTWDGQQIVSAEWVRAATQKHVGTDSQLGYGYQWWIYPSFGAYTALGRNGQTIFVVPDLRLVIVTTAALDGHEEIFQLIEKYIVPAAQKT